MAEVATTISPKKIPIDDWIDAVKKVDPKGLKPDEKKVFEQVKAHKNIPKTSAKFSNFCIHNLKVKDEKLINKIWGQLSGAQHELKTKIVSKETKDEKKAKLEKKLEVKKDKVEGKREKSEGKKDKQSPVAAAATTNGKAKPTKADVIKKAVESPKDAKKVPAVAASAKVDKVVGAKKLVQQANGTAQLSKKQLKKLQHEQKQQQQQQQTTKVAPKETKDSKKAELEKKLKPTGKGSKQEIANGKAKQQQQQQQAQKKGKGVVAENANKKQEVTKKKVSFSKSEDVVSAKKGNLSKAHKQTPKKVELKKSGKKKADEDEVEEEEEDDDDDEFSDDALSFGSDDSDIDLDDSDAEEISFDDSDDSDDDDDDDEDDEEVDMEDSDDDDVDDDDDDDDDE